MSGIEIAGIVLAVFPLVIRVLEHYQGAYDSARDFAHFRREFAQLVNEVNREQIIFRLHIEAMLRSVSTEPEFLIQEMMNNTQDWRWKSPKLAQRLQQTLSGDGEYENYRASMREIHDNLSSISKRLSTFDSVVSNGLPKPCFGTTTDWQQ